MKTRTEARAIINENINRGVLSQYFAKPQQGTSGVILRTWLLTQSKQIANEWGIKAIEDLGMTIAAKDDGRGNYQEIE